MPLTTVEIPATLLHGFDPVLCSRASQNLIFNHAYDVSKLRRIIGFEHEFSLEEGIKQTIDFQRRWGLLEATGDDPEDWLIELFQQQGETIWQSLGEELRQTKGYQVPDGSPLVKWAPDHYQPDVAAH